MKIKELPRHCLESYRIEKIAQELATLNLETDCSAYYRAFRSERKSRRNDEQNPEIISIGKTFEILHELEPLVGKPINYEKKTFFKGIQKFDEFERRIVTPGRILDWTPRSLQKTVDACNLIAPITSSFYVSSSNKINLYCPVECQISVLYKTSDPKKWEEYNARKAEQLAKRRKIAAVGKKLDGIE